MLTQDSKTAAAWKPETLGLLGASGNRKAIVLERGKLNNPKERGWDGICGVRV